MLLLFTTAIVLSGSVFGTELCKSKEWYDDLAGKCRKCQSCVGKYYEVAPCTAFMNTMCVDLTELSRSLESNIKAGEKALQRDAGQHSKLHRWHEMEGRNVENSADVDAVKEATVSKNLLEGSFDYWDLLFVTILGFLCVFFVIIIILGTMKCYKRPSIFGDRAKVVRSRLFSRDRLNTTDHMNNLATLDRRLAIDEILEKKKRAAIFEPQLLNENVYTDEVFIDISGLPRNLRPKSRHDYEEVDHTKCLLELEIQTETR